jgi:hypothetical protein
MPWHAAQYSKNICLPRSVEEDLTGVRCACICCPTACVEKSDAVSTATVLKYRIFAPRFAL